MGRVGLSKKRRPSDIIKKGVKGLKAKSYDDVESVVITVGVIAALVLSFSVGLQYVVPPAQVQAGNFRQLICDSNKFRGFALDLIAEEDVGKHKEEKFDFIVPAFKYNDKTFDIRDVINDVQRKYGEYPDYAGEDNKNAYPNTDCREDKYVQIAVRLMVDAFPMEMMESFILHEELEDLTFSAWMEYLARISSDILMLCIITSVLLYLSLVVSPSRDDESAIAGWLKYGWFGMFTTYFLLVGGVATFYIANTNFLQATSPFARQADQLQEEGFQQVWAPILLFFFVICVLALWGACSKRYKEENKKDDEDKEKHKDSEDKV